MRRWRMPSAGGEGVNVGRLRLAAVGGRRPGTERLADRPKHSLDDGRFDVVR
jgi:hypothetical protein